MYRRNLKNIDNERYKEYLNKQKQRMKAYRQEIKNDEEKIKNQREKAKIRQKQYRERKKLQGKDVKKESIPKPKTPRTRSTIEAQRKQWKEAKQKYRQNLSAAQKAWQKRKDRTRKMEKKMKKQTSQTACTMPVTSPACFKSKRTLYNITAKARKTLPKSPSKFATVITNLVKNSTPQKRKALATLLSPTLNKQRTEERIEDEHLNDIMQADKLDSDLTKDKDEIMTRVDTVDSNRNKHKDTRKRRLQLQVQHKYKISALTIRQVKNFYLREGISVPLPQKRYTTKHGPCYVMQVSLRGAFALFVKEHKGAKIGFVKFTTLRPKNIRLLNTTTHWNYCVCTVCQNISYKLKALNRCTTKKIRDVDELLNIALCAKNDGQRFHAAECIFGTCEKCKDLNLEDNLSLYVDSDRKDKKQEVSWNHWEKSTIDGKVRKVLKTKRSNVDNLIREMMVDVREPIQSTSFPQHEFVGKWQQRQFSELKRNLPPDTLLLVMDFGKNKTVRYQDEPKSVYYTARQITLHPIVVFYNHPETLQLVTRNSLIFLSDDISHDHHAVNHFFDKAVSHVKDLGIDFSKIIVFSDGCASQYKGKGSFADLSLKDISIERNFFGSDHGKSECDGEIGSINRAVDMAIVGRKAVISDAMEMHIWCMGNLKLDEPGSKRTFFHVKPGEIDRTRETTNVNSLKGCRKLHQFMNIPASPYKLLVKKLSCYCTNCRDGDFKLCINKEYTGEIQEVSLLPSKVTKPSGKQEKTYKKTKLSTKTAKTPKSNEKLGQVFPGTSNSNRKPVKSTGASHGTPKSSDKAIKTETETCPTQTVKNTVDLWGNLSSCKTYEELQEVVINSEAPPLPEPDMVTFTSHRRVIDEKALDLLPEEFTGSGLYPSIIYGDGNCLPRCASLIAYGHEENHLEMRARIIEEHVRNEDKYLDDKYLTRGINPEGYRNVAVQLAMFSENYRNEELSPLGIQRLYRREVLGLCRSGRYCGMWQIAAMANVLKKPVMSVYPQYSSTHIRKDMHRTFEPFDKTVQSDTVFIMWSNLLGKSLAEREWTANHFVPLLKLLDLDPVCTKELPLVEDVYSFINSSLVNSIIDGLGDTFSVESDNDWSTLKNPVNMSTADPTPENPVVMSIADPTPDNPVVMSTADPTPEMESVNDWSTLENPVIMKTLNPMLENLVVMSTADPTPENPVVMNTADPMPENPVVISIADPTPDNPAATSTVDPKPDNPVTMSFKTQDPLLKICGGQSSVQVSYKPGQYVLVAHGNCSLPAVVDEWPYVFFLNKKRAVG